MILWLLLLQQGNKIFWLSSQPIPRCLRLHKSSLQIFVPLTILPWQQHGFKRNKSRVVEKLVLAKNLANEDVIRHQKHNNSHYHIHLNLCEKYRRCWCSHSVCISILKQFSLFFETVTKSMMGSPWGSNNSRAQFLVKGYCWRAIRKLSAMIPSLMCKVTFTVGINTKLWPKVNYVMLLFILIIVTGFL